MVHNSDEESSDERNVNEPVTENEAPGSLASMFIANRNAPIIMNIKVSDRCLQNSREGNLYYIHAEWSCMASFIWPHG